MSKSGRPERMLGLVGVLMCQLPVGTSSLAWAASTSAPSRQTFKLISELRQETRPAALRSEGPTILFLNRGGATIVPGPDDASTNHSSLADDTVYIPAYEISQANWQTIVDCVAGQFAAFDVQVTDAEPERSDHVEVVIGGLASDLNPSIDVSGLSPFTRDCSVVPNAMVYVFAASLPDDSTQQVCEIIAQEVAHSFGLDHAFLCQDTLSYLGDCGAKSFQPLAVACGEEEARSCANPAIGYDCQRDLQNSVELLAAVLGVRDGDLAPTGYLVGVEEGAVRPPGFALEVVAEDADSAISLVELRIDGVQVDIARAPPYLLRAPENLGNGLHQIEAIVHAGALSKSLAIRVTIEGGEPDSLVIGGCSLSVKALDFSDALWPAFVLLGLRRRRLRAR